ncbi:ABC transporter substrate-binding protein [Pseudonocardia alaniniphila]|uniref:ABC transporter substrate-binding protein n=1 Tax=Pseudonocardia alaniniphila TaxID=75291 RepID=A0ABS9T733_9PSEU|nr:ABC transporter substrate-binding protein [Pseudonocardia alaniniphila]MCH6164334.1 ABC transporter substrate-binding protein [Pseudonocardia alaniniphila]
MRWQRRRARLVGAIAAILGIVVVASGCGAADPAATRADIRSVNAWGGDIASEGAPKHGGTLRLGMDREIVSFDPTVQNANMATFAVYDSLMKLTPDGTAQPYLAKSMDSPDGGLTWRLELRPDVKFSDGTPLDADAVLVNVQRHIDKTASPAHPYAEQIASMRALDPLTVEFTLKSPLGSFPVVFAQSITYGTLGVIISPAALQQYGDDIGRHPVGAGPFRFVEWIPDSRLVLERNPNYWQPDQPYLDQLEFRPLPDTESRYASIQNGDVDLIFAAYNQELVRAFEDPALSVYYGPGSAGEYLYFNFARAPFDDRRMREAVVRALDMKALSASLYNNQLVTATSLFDTDSPDHTEAASQEWPTYDPERAKQLIAEYRASGGNPDFTLKTTTARTQFGEFLQAQMAAVGITVKLQFYDLAQYSSQVVQSGDFDLTTTVSAFDAPFPGASRLVQTGGNTNYGKYSNPEVDKLLATAASTSDEAERTKAYQQVELQVNRDLVACWLSRSYLATIAKPQVKGIDRYTSRDMFYARVWLDRPSQ